MRPRLGWATYQPGLTHKLQSRCDMLLAAVLLQDGEEVLIDFAERRTRIERLVHPRLHVCLG